MKKNTKYALLALAALLIVAAVVFINSQRTLAVNSATISAFDLSYVFKSTKVLWTA